MNLDTFITLSPKELSQKSFCKKIFLSLLMIDFLLFIPFFYLLFSAGSIEQMSRPLLNIFLVLQACFGCVIYFIRIRFYRLEKKEELIQIVEEAPREAFEKFKLEIEGLVRCKNDTQKAILYKKIVEEYPQLYKITAYVWKKI